MRLSKTQHPAITKAEPKATGTVIESLLLAEAADPAESIGVANAAFIVEGEVIEVLPVLGLAHMRGSDGLVYGLRPHTPGVDWGELREGQRFRCLALRSSIVSFTPRSSPVGHVGGILHPEGNLPPKVHTEIIKSVYNFS